jgi:tetratricopeptide (TPR) repeat protein
VTKKIIHITVLFAILILPGCSGRKNNATTRAYHAFTARYNTYYNGDLAYKQGIKTQSEGHKDNYLEQLPLFIISNKNTRKLGGDNYDRAIEKAQKAIKNHSIKRKPKRPTGKKLTEKQKLFYSQKEFNPFLWRVWFLMADSQFQKGEFEEAASTYIYIAKLYENNPGIVARARIGLAQCYTEMEWLYEAEDLLMRTRRDSIPQSMEKDFARAKGNLLLKQERSQEAIEYVKTGIERKGTTNIDKAREQYLLGQLYARNGEMKEAYKSFGKTISKSPPYELEFNARIRQTETATDENHKKILRKLKKMARSPKNKEYLSQINYAIGNIYMSQCDTAEAIKAYETGVAEGATSGYGTAMLHLSLAKIYWEMERFSKSHENYSKALPLIEEEHDEYATVKFRNDVLGDIIQYTDIVEEQDKLLYWASLQPEQLYPIIDELIKEEKRKEELRKKEEKKLQREENGDNALEDMSMDLNIPDNNEKAQWYFYNKQLVSQGLRTFKQKWGERTLKDYWRFSHEISSLMSGDTMPEDSVDIYAEENEEIIESDSIILDEEIEEEPEVLETDPTTREFYIQQIPDTEEKREAANIALRNALFEAGVKFKDNVGDKNLTISYLERIVNEFPEFERMAETYYQLFIAGSRWNEPEKAEYYKNLLIAGYPDSSFTKAIQQPDFFDDAATRTHKEDSMYVKAYNHYIQKEYDKVEYENITAETKYPKGKHRARFMFIDAMAKLYGGKHEEALESLGALIEKYSNDSISIMAGNISTGIKEGRLLQSGINTSIWDKKADGTIKSEKDSVPSFSNNRNEPYYFVLAFPNDSVDEKRLLFEMARYNFSRYMVRNFDMSFEKFTAITLFEIKEFLNFDEAFLYRKRLYENGEMARLLEGMNSMIISKTNLDLLLNHYSFGDYQEFYERSLLIIPEVEIDGYTLDEPDYKELENE